MSFKPTLYYIPGSPPARSVLMVARALNVELNLKLVDMANREHFGDAFLALNPQHTVPVLTVEDGESIVDSHAIALYLIERYGATSPARWTLYPTGADELLRRARIQQRLHFDTSVLFPLVRDLYLLFAVGGATAVPDAIRAQAHDAWDFLEMFLSKSAWLVGGTLTVADVAAITSVKQVATHVPVEVGRWSLLAMWMERFALEAPELAQINDEGVAGYEAVMDAHIKTNTEKTRK